MNNLTILHLTDIHIGYNFVYEKTRDLAFRIGDQLANHPKNIDLILISGDIFDGRANKTKNENSLIEEAVDFFHTLIDRINKIQSKQLTIADVLFLPGNHDLNRDSSDIFSTYRTFLEKVHSSNKSAFKNYNSTYLYSFRIFTEQKVIVLGLNSCKIEKESPDNSGFKWLENIKLSDKTKNSIKKAYSDESKEKWYDYGYIELQQINNALDELKSCVGSLESYNIVVSFHHHIHPFPEIYGRTGDISLIKNFEPIIEKLQSLEVKLVLHGHKHLPLIRPIVNDKFLKDPSSVIYVVAGGNIGSKDLMERYFQIVEVYDKEEKNKIAGINRFQFKQESAEDPVLILIPPKPVDEASKTKLLNEILKVDNSSLHDEYENEIYDRDNVSREKSIDSIIECISNILTSFKTVKEKLVSFSHESLWVILFIHYRINANFTHFTSNDTTPILELIKKFYFEKSNLSNANVSRKIFRYLELQDNHSERQEIYDFLHEKDKTAFEKRIIAYAIVASYFTDLYQVLSNYADFYYQSIEHKINIKLDKNKFHQEIPSNHIHFVCEADRRSVIVKLKSKSPTSHKIAVMFIKSFEINLARFEKDFDEIGLKTYYIIPRIEKDINQYQLDDYNFEAYIPSLLPLLIGESIYNRKEVFIRELVQNSMDAILLKEDIYSIRNQSIDFDKKIRITYSKEKKNSSSFIEDRKDLVYTIKVFDNGIGMNQSLIERYFVHLGRSFYNSQEYKDLLDKHQTRYRPLSKFGIGFLTSFLVCREIRVQTRHFDTAADGLDIYIPNHEGCFFITKNGLTSSGTVVNLYEDPNSPIEINKIIQYAFDVFLDLQLDLEILCESSKCKEKDNSIEKHSIRKRFFSQTSKVPSFFIPLTTEGLLDREYSDSELLYNQPFGIIFTYRGRSRRPEEVPAFVEMNCGIKLAEGSKLRKYYRNGCFDIYVNYPPNYIELDVSREKIKQFKVLKENTSFKSDMFQKNIFEKLSHQVSQWLCSEDELNKAATLFDKHQMINFLSANNESGLELFFGKVSVVKATVIDKKVIFSFALKSQTLDLSENEAILDYEADMLVGIDNLLYKIGAVGKGIKIDQKYIRELNRTIKDISLSNSSHLDKIENIKDNITKGPEENIFIKSILRSNLSFRINTNRKRYDTNKGHFVFWYQFFFTIVDIMFRFSNAEDVTSEKSYEIALEEYERIFSKEP